jgi:AraC family cel operon transcriptional repressor
VVPGTVQLIQPSDSHTFAARSNRDFEWTNVAFYSSSWRSLRRRYFPEGVRYFDLPDWRLREFVLSKEQLSELRLAAAALNRGARDRLAFERFLLNALSLLPGISPSRSAPPAWLSELKQELQQQIHFATGPSPVVQKAGRCPEHVCREFRRYFDCTPTAAMTAARMEYAGRQLIETDVKIVDLALEIGLNNLGHFYRSFERYFSCTPRQYRQRHFQSVQAGF